MSVRYKKADCTLYRLPPVHLGSLALYLDDQIAEGWRNNLDPNALLASLATDTKVIGAIRQQIGTNVAFQRQQELDRISLEEKVSAEKIEQQTATIVRTYAREADHTIAQQRTVTERATAEKTEQEAQYSVARQRLAELRNQVRSQIFEIGGKEGYETLLEIDRQIRESAAAKTPVYDSAAQTSTTPYTTGTAATPTLAAANAPVVAPVSVQDLEQKVGELLQEPKKKKRGLWGKFVRLFVVFPGDEE